MKIFLSYLKYVAFLLCGFSAVNAVANSRLVCPSTITCQVHVLKAGMPVTCDWSQASKSYLKKVVSYNSNKQATDKKGINKKVTYGFYHAQIGHDGVSCLYSNRTPEGMVTVLAIARIFNAKPGDIHKWHAGSCSANAETCYMTVGSSTKPN